MKPGARHRLGLVGTLAGVVLPAAVFERFLHPPPPPMTFGLALTAAAACRRNRAAPRQPLPAAVSLAELTHRGVLRAAGVPGPAALEATLALQLPQDVRTRVRLPAGDKLVALAEGSLQPAPRQLSTQPRP